MSSEVQSEPVSDLGRDAPVSYDGLQNLLREAGFDGASSRPANRSMPKGWARFRCRPGDISHAHGWLFRRDGQRKRHPFGLRFLLAAGVFAAGASGKKFLIIRGYRSRVALSHEVHEKVYEFAPKIVAERGLVKGERISASTVRRWRPTLRCG